MRPRFVAFGVMLFLACAGCGKKETESLVVMRVRAAPPITGTVPVTIHVGDVVREIDVENGIGNSEIRLGVYVPARVTGQTDVEVRAPDGTGCTLTATGSVNIESPGRLYELSAPLTLAPAGCGDGGTPSDGGADIGPADSGPADTLPPVAPPSLTVCQDLSEGFAPPGCKPLDDAAGFSVWALAFSRDGKLLASASQEGSTMLWNVDGSAVTPEYMTVTSSAMRTLSFSPDGTMLAAAGDSGQIYVLRGQSLAMALATKDSANAAAIDWIGFSGDNDRFLTAKPADSTLKVWSVTARGTTAQVTTSPIAAVATGFPAPLAGPWWAALISSTNNASFVDLNAAAPRPTAEFNVAATDHRLALSADGNTLATVNGGTVNLWNASNKDAPVRLPIVLHAGTLLRSGAMTFDAAFGTLAFSPSGQHIVATITGHLDGTPFNAFSMYSVDTGEELNLSADAKQHLSVAFSPDGRAVAIGESCGFIQYCRD